ncbi:MAG: hypothetical protein KF812_05230 [Fimbriimonadaceae bacterium]|nr:hypothetical protein [Fimbriimonadaceae bacterium]
MVFKDQAQALVTRWEQETTRHDWFPLIVHTSVVLSADSATPDRILDALDALLSDNTQGRARSVFQVVGYLRQLAARADVEPSIGPQVIRLR